MPTILEHLAALFDKDMRAVVVGNIPMSAAITAGINTVITAKETASAGEGSSADAVFMGSKAVF